MKPLILAAVLLTSPGLYAQAPAANEKTENIRKLINLTGGTKIIDQMFNAMAANFTDPKQKQAFEALRKEFDPTQIFEILIPAYEKFLSADDVKAVLTFYESPAGQKMLDAQPKIMAESLPKIIQWSQEVSARVAQKMKELEAK
jgi:uncharacterized protein